jgi:glycosyltransferase involved in cell wall biosynthesis
MTELPSITIVTATYNAAATLPETIESVRAQDYPGPVEHIIVDGASTDATLDLVRAAGLRYVSEPDRGLTHALNKGMAMATHDVVGSLNADDTYLPGALDRVGRALRDHPEAEWVTGRCRIVDGEGSEIRPRVTAYKNFFLRHHSFRLHLLQNHVSAPATFVRRAALEAVGGYDERFAYSADYDMWLKLGRRGDPVVLDAELATFRMAGDTLSLTGFEAQFQEHAVNAAEHGPGHPIAVALNRTLSRAIVLTYRLMHRRRSA